MTSSAASSWAGNVRVAAVIGAGTMGEGIAQIFAESGIEVRLIDINEAALQRCLTQIGDNIALAAQCGLSGDSAVRVLERIVPVVSSAPAEHIGDADIVVETIPEILQFKRTLFSQLDGLGPNVLIGSNTSSMTLTAICQDMRTPERAAGLHFFNPAHIIPAVEIHRSARTSDETVARARALLQRIGKVPLLVNAEIPGLVINRLTGALMREIYHLLEEQVVTPEELDAGITASLGFRMAAIGPMESADFTGLDVGLRVVTALLPQLSNRTTPPGLLTDRVAAGDLGIKTGKGWLDYHGRTRDDLLQERNVKLLEQLKLFRQTKVEL